MKYPLLVDCEAADEVIMWLRWHKRAAACQGYVTGGPDIEWTTQQFARWPRKIRTVQAPGDPAAAAIAREIDVETGAATPADVPQFLADRASHGHAGDGQVYCSLETVPAVVEAVGGNILTVPRWRLAWWWGRPGQPTPAQVLAELYRLTGIDLPGVAERLWACQYRNAGRWDLNAVYGVQDYDR